MASQPTTSTMPLRMSDGAIAGIIGGLVYSAYALPVNVLMNGADTLFAPLRQIGAVGLGAQALDPSYDLTTAVAAGLAIHFLLSIVYGMAFAAIANVLNIRSTGSLIIGGALFGLAIYAINLFVAFPMYFPWFLANDRVVQSIGHAVFFGAPLGWWLSSRRAHAL